MKKSKCPHARVYRERGRTVPVWVREYPLAGSEWYWKRSEGPTVVEVCDRCGKRREIGFKKEGPTR